MDNEIYQKLLKLSKVQTNMIEINKKDINDILKFLKDIVQIQTDQDKEIEKLKKEIKEKSEITLKDL